MNPMRLQRRMNRDRRALNRMADSDNRSIRATDRVLCALAGAFVACLLILLTGSN